MNRGCSAVRVDDRERERVVGADGHVGWWWGRLREPQAGDGGRLGSPFVDGNVGAMDGLVDPHPGKHRGEVRTRFERNLHTELLQRRDEVQVGGEVPAGHRQIHPARVQPSRHVGECVGCEQLPWCRLVRRHQDPHGE
jgi:hypothetical protein